MSGSTFKAYLDRGPNFIVGNDCDREICQNWQKGREVQMHPGPKDYTSRLHVILISQAKDPNFQLESQAIDFTKISSIYIILAFGDLLKFSFPIKVI